MYRYVRVDINGLPIEDFWYSEEVHETDKIPIPLDFNLTNKKYADGKWVDINPVPEWEQDLIDENTQTQLEMQTNIQYLVDLAEIEMEG